MESFTKRKSHQLDGLELRRACENFLTTEIMEMRNLTATQSGLKETDALLPKTSSKRSGEYGWCLRDIANMIVSQPTAEIETPLEKPQPIEQETKDNESDVKRQYRWSIRNMTNVMTIQPKTKIETLPEKINPTENNEDNLEKECVYLVETKFLGKAISAEEEALIRSRLAAEEETQEIRKNNIKEDDSDVRDIIVDILWESIIAINASASESSGTKRKTVQVGNDGGRGWLDCCCFKICNYNNKS